MFPMPGIEPGPPGWKPGILAIRPHGIADRRREILGLHSPFERTPDRWERAILPGRAHQN